LTKRVLFGIAAILCIGFALRLYQLTADLPYVDLGSSGAFLLDEGVYQASAAHKVLFGSWQMPGIVYYGWTVRAYNLWLYPFFKIFGVTLFAARLSCMSAFMLGLGILMMGLRRYVAPMVLLVFGLLSATNYLLVMWSKMPLPYTVVLLPVSGLLLTTVFAIARKSVLYAALAGFFAFLCVSVKEPALLFFPISAAAIMFGFRIYHGARVRDMLLNKVLWTYIASFVILFALYQVYYLAPVANEWWNDSAQQARIVANDAVKGLTSPALQSGRQHYGALSALEKFFLKFLGMKYIAWVWVLAFLSLGLIAIGRKQIVAQLKNNVGSLVSLYMFLWAVIMIPGLVITRMRGGLAIHWSPLYLTPIIYFAALGFYQLWHYTKGAQWLKVTRGIALVLLLGAVTTDLNQYHHWLKQLPEYSKINEVADQIADAVQVDNASPTILMFDAPIVALRHPEVNVIALRDFQAKFISNVYPEWKPQYVVVQEAALRPQNSEAVVKTIRDQGFTLKSIGSYPVGVFDGSDVSLTLYKLKKKTL